MKRNIIAIVGSLYFTVNFLGGISAAYFYIFLRCVVCMSVVCHVYAIA